MKKIVLNEEQFRNLIKQGLIKEGVLNDETDLSQEYWNINDEIGEEEMCKLVTEWIGENGVIKMVWNYCKENNDFDRIIPWLKEHAFGISPYGQAED